MKCASIVVIAVTTSALVAGYARADFMGGQSPFTNHAGTGTIVENAEGRGGNLWYDDSTMEGPPSTPYRSTSSVGYLTYEETWTTPKTVGTLLLAATGRERDMSGNIYGQFSSGGPFSLLTTFSQTMGRITFPDLNQTGLHGLRVEVTGGAADYYQIGSVGFYEQRFTNDAFGLPSVHSPGATYSGNITDQYIKSDIDTTQFRSAGNGAGTPDEEFTGVDFGAGKLLRGLLVDTAPHPDPWPWRNFDVQVYRSGAWVTLGRANASGGDMYWIDFGPNGEFADMVRLYGSTVGGNNPDVKIITDIMVFEGEEVRPIPEPATMALLGLGVLAAVRRRRRA